MLKSEKTNKLREKNAVSFDEFTRNKTRSEIVTDSLRELIIQGQLLPGEHLQEVVIADRMGVSRTPVRSALEKLTSEGFLDHKPNQGYFIRNFDVADIKDAYNIRALLESEAARRAALSELITKEQRVILKNYLEGGSLVVHKEEFNLEDLAEYRNININIHDMVIQLSGSLRLKEHIERLHNLPFVSDSIIVWWDKPLLQRSHDDHHRIIEAILQRNSRRAEALMYEHVYFSGAALLDHLAKEGGLYTLKST